ncbi:MAG: hypothetical protein L0H31_09155, partial [Nocardioidaceae bacterium]|nr:hypothetical protein [Nocardioidaceae bacterium]
PEVGGVHVDHDAWGIDCVLELGCGCCRFVAAFCDRYLALSRISEHFSTLRRPWLIARMQK